MVSRLIARCSVSLAAFCILGLGAALIAGCRDSVTTVPPPKDAVAPDTVATDSAAPSVTDAVSGSAAQPKGTVASNEPLPYVSTRQLKGVAMDERRHALKGIRVSAYRIVDDRLKFEGDTSTKDTGQYVFDNAPPGEYVLHFQDLTGRHREQTYPDRAAFERLLVKDINRRITLSAPAAGGDAAESPALSVALVPAPLANVQLSVTETEAATPAPPLGLAAQTTMIGLLSSTAAITEVVGANCSPFVGKTIIDSVVHYEFCQRCGNNRLQFDVSATFPCELDTVHGGVYYRAPDGTIQRLCSMTSDAGCTISNSKSSANGEFTYTWSITNSTVPVHHDADIVVWWACKPGSADGEYSKTGLTDIVLAKVKQCDPTGRLTNGIGGPVVDASVYLYEYSGPLPCNATAPYPAWTNTPPAGMATTASAWGKTNSNGDYNLPPTLAACYIVKAMPTTGKSGTATGCPTSKFSPPVTGSAIDVDYQCP